MNRELASTGPPRGWVRWFAAYSGNRRLFVYALSVMLSGLSLLFLAAWHGDRTELWSFTLVIWFVINLASELLWLETASEEGTDSMALTMNFAAILLLAPAIAVWAISLSVFIATRFIQKRDIFKTFFGLGQMAVTAALTTAVFHLLFSGPLTVEAFRSLGFISAMLACACVYFFANTFLVAGALSLTTGGRLWLTWRENWGHRNNIVSSVALFSLAPVVLLAYLSIGFFGVLLFFLPLLIIKEQNREHIRLKRMMQEIVDQEKMAERGKLAAGIAHEMNNYLAIIKGRLQILAVRVVKLGDEKMQADINVIGETTEHMRVMAKGLMDFSHRGIKTELTDVNLFLVRQIDLLRPHPVLKGVEILPELSPDVGVAEVDPGQIGQVLVNLIKNAAEAIKGQEVVPDAPMITIRSHVVKGERVCIEVEDNGPGMPKAVWEKIFDAFYTTKKDGHGFGLATCRTILSNHKGKIWVESEMGKGTTFLLEFPRRSPDAKAGQARDVPRSTTSGKPEGGDAVRSVASVKPETGDAVRSVAPVKPETGDAARSVAPVKPETGDTARSAVSAKPETGDRARPAASAKLEAGKAEGVKPKTAGPLDQPEEKPDPRNEAA